MIIETFTITPFQQNTRILACESERVALCVDPGEPCSEIGSFLTREELELRAIALTHAHLDHVGGTLALSEEYPAAEIIIHKDDEQLYLNLPMQPLALGIPPTQMEALGMKYDNPPKPTRYFEDGETLSIGKLRFRVLHCPGHTPGHVVLAEETEKKVFVGDCLFDKSVGRTDLPGGSYDQLMESIREKILPLGDDFTVYSGHGPETTIGSEKQANPFLNGTYDAARGRFI